MITVNILALVLVYKSFCNTVCIYGHANKAGCCCSACIYFVETPLESRYKPRAIFQRQWGVGCGGGGLKILWREKHRIKRWAANNKTNSRTSKHSIEFT